MRTNDRCEWTRPRLPLLAGDPEGRELPWNERRRVERHLIGCEACRRVRGSLESIIGLLRESASVAPAPIDAPSLWPDLARQIRSSRHPRPSSSWFGLGVGRSFSLAAVLLVAGIAIGLVGGRLGGPPDERVTAPVRFEVPVLHRPALPGPGLADAQARGEARLAIDVDPKNAMTVNPRDPQRSQ